MNVTIVGLLKCTQIHSCFAEKEITECSLDMVVIFISYAIVVRRQNISTSSALNLEYCFGIKKIVKICDQKIMKIVKSVFFNGN